MKLSRKQGCLLALVAVPLVLWAVYRLIYPSYTWHQKITVTVETPSGEVSGSSIAEVSWWGTPKILPDATPRHNTVKAEATVVELPNGQYLFALVKTAHLIARAVIFDPIESISNNHDPYLYPASRMKSFRGKVHVIKPKHYPLMVTFGDINDPASVKRVDPDDLDSALGLCPDGSGLKNRNAPWRAKKMTYRAWSRYKASGVSSLAEYRVKHFNRMQEEALEAAIRPRDTSADCHRLKSITLEITSDPVTEGKVEDVLEWIIDAGYLIPPEQQPKYAKDQTIEQRIRPSDLIDWQTRKAKREALK